MNSTPSKQKRFARSFAGIPLALSHGRCQVGWREANPFPALGNRGHHKKRLMPKRRTRRNTPRPMTSLAGEDKRCIQQRRSRRVLTRQTVRPGISMNAVSIDEADESGAAESSAGGINERPQHRAG